MNITLVNEFAMFAGELGVDMWKAIDVAPTKPFGYMRFTPGPGVGGHCLPIDPSYLSWRVRRLGRRVPVRRARQRHQRAHAQLRRSAHPRCSTSRTGRCAAPGARARHHVQGATGDWRESPSVVVGLRPACRACGWSRALTRTSRWRIASVCPWSSRQYSAASLRSAEIVAVLVDHPEFDADEIARESALVFDAKGMLRGRTFTGECL